MHEYRQRTGMWLQDHQYVSHGYSGHGEGKNEPLLQPVHDVGPIPVGRYTIGPLLTPQELHEHKLGGPVFRLLPCPGTETFGRGGFLCHGGSLGLPGVASHGCIILPQFIRLFIWKTGDRDLTVVSGDEPSSVTT